MCINHRVYGFLSHFSSAICHNIPISLLSAFFPKLLWSSSSESSPATHSPVWFLVILSCYTLSCVIPRNPLPLHTLLCDSSESSPATHSPVWFPHCILLRFWASAPLLPHSSFLVHLNTHSPLFPPKFYQLSFLANAPLQLLAYVAYFWSPFSLKWESGYSVSGVTLSKSLGSLQM